MWKNKTDRICRFCKETFCCAKCRNHHVNKIHPGLNIDCCLCASELLPVRYGEFEKLNLRDEELLNHIADKHLPLRCQLCGDLYESKEDFKSFGKCKWWSQHSLTSPIGLEQKLKQCFMTDCNNGYTPPEIYRKTSTPMLGQKATFETPCVPYFSLKTPKTNSPSSINAQKSQNNDIFISVTEFFSFSHISNEDETTPFRTANKDELIRSNSGRKLNIMEERDETEKITVDEPVDMNLTKPEGCSLELPILSDVICEESDKTLDVVKKVRFSDQHETMPECKSSINKSCVKIVLNTSAEENFHDANEILSTPNVKNTKDISDVKAKNNTTKIAEDIKNTKDSQVESLKKYSFVKPLQNSTIGTQIVQNDTKKNTEKENRNPEINDRGPSSDPRHLQDTNRILITVLMESNSGGLSTDLMPLIDSSLKKLQELASTNQSSLVESTDAVHLRNKSVTKMEMSISNVESYSTKDATTDNRQIVPSPSLSMRNVRNNTSNNGFFAVVAQAMKYALKSFSGLGISTNKTEVIEQRKIVAESTSTSQESSVNVASSSIQLRPTKRARENAEVSSRVDSIIVDIQSPLAKRQKGWYTMIKGRQPINRMRNRTRNNHSTSSSGVQVFSQGSLTVGDTVLPLPARAHQSTQTE